MNKKMMGDRKVLLVETKDFLTVMFPLVFLVAWFSDNLQIVSLRWAGYRMFFFLCVFKYCLNSEAS